MDKESRNRTSDGEALRLQELLARFEALGDPAARAAVQELVRVVIDLHGRGLSDLLGIVRDAGSQPADTLLARFTVNPAVRGMLLLHGLHPEDLATRASKAVERLRPHLGVRGVRADLIGVEDDVVRLRVSASGQKNQRPSAIDLQREIENTVLEMTPDAADLIIEGLEAAGGATEVYVALSAITRPSKTNTRVTTSNDIR
jgi:NifU-like domain